MSAIEDRLEAAWARRSALRQRLALEGTDSYRLFHGSVEGRPGWTLDRYGPLLLWQTYDGAPADEEQATVRAWVAARMPGSELLLRDRGAAQPSPGPTPHVHARELGLRYRVPAREAGTRDPWLFLDLRMARRWLRAEARGRAVLNIFAYTGALGLAALAGGASEVWQVDHSRRHLELAAANLADNALPAERVRHLPEDAFAVLRQLAGLPLKGRGARRRFTPLEPRQFELVVLDPPTWATGPLGAVDINNDYPALFKPALLATAPGGRLLVTHHHVATPWPRWRSLLERCAAKAGRPLRSIERIWPDDDLPAKDDDPPLKVALIGA